MISDLAFKLRFVILMVSLVAYAFGANSSRNPIEKSLLEVLLTFTLYLHNQFRIKIE